MVRICNGADLPAADDDKVYMLRSNGNVSHEIWDVTRPRTASLVTTVVGGLTDTHKNEWDCDTGLGYLVGGRPQWGHRPHDDALRLERSRAAGPHPRLRASGSGAGRLRSQFAVQHARRLQVGDRFYNGVGTSANGVFEIWDVSDLRTAATPLETSLISRQFLPRYMGAHTTFPQLGIPVRDDEEFYWDTRDILVVSNESTANECREAHQQAFFVDITDERNPFGISNYKVPESEGDFCDRGGRFGNHSSNENFTDRYYRKIVFFAYFNAGIRAVDIRDPFNPKEVGKYIPATTDDTVERCVQTDPDPALDRCKTAIQTNNLDTDDRELVHAVDRANTGLHIVTVTGRARDIMRARVRPNPDDETPTFDELEGE
jgi:hypothetical protein